MKADGLTVETTDETLILPAMAAYVCDLVSMNTTPYNNAAVALSREIDSGRLPMEASNLERLKDMAMSAASA